MFKKEFEIVHDQYQAEVSRALPANLDGLKDSKNENDDHWRILKYYDQVISLESRHKFSEIKAKQIGKMNLENGRVN